MCYSKLKHTRSSTQNKVTKISWSSKNTWSFCWWIILYCTKYLGKRKWGTSSWLVPYHTTYIHYTVSPCIVWIARYGFCNFCHPVLIHLHVDLNQCFTDRQSFHILIAYETFVYFGQVIFQSEVGWLKSNRNIKSY